MRQWTQWLIMQLNRLNTMENSEDLQKSRACSMSLSYAMIIGRSVCPTVLEWNSFVDGIWMVRNARVVCPDNELDVHQKVRRLSDSNHRVPQTNIGVLICCLLSLILPNKHRVASLATLKQCLWYFVFFDSQPAEVVGVFELCFVFFRGEFSRCAHLYTSCTGCIAK